MSDSLTVIDIIKIIIAIPSVFVLIVFFHELGHFLVARWCGVKVESFSIGFGREIFGFTDQKGTRWKFAWIPLGGYVKFIDDENSASVPSPEAIAAMTEEQRAGAFQLKPLWQRAAVVAAGPIASFLLGIIIFTVQMAFYGKEYQKPVIGEVMANSPAAKAGFIARDEVMSINGHEINSFDDIIANVQISQSQELEFKIKRNDQILDFKVTPQNQGHKDILGGSMKTIGIRASNKPEDRVYIPASMTHAPILALEETYRLITLPARYLFKVATLEESPKNLSGPISIGMLIAKLVDSIYGLLFLAAALSISIGFFNLFPIPMLDGGHLMFYAIEAVRGKPLSERAQEISFRVGLAILLTLMVFVNILDVKRLVNLFF